MDDINLIINVQKIVYARIDENYITAGFDNRMEKDFSFSSIEDAQIAFNKLKEDLEIK